MRRSLAIAAVIAAVLAGCGGGSHHETVPPEAMLDAAAAHPIGSADAEIEARLRVDGVPRLSGPISLHLDGPYRSGGGTRIPSFDWRLSASALGFPVGGRLVSTGDNVYLTVYGNQYEVGAPAVADANARLAEAGGLRLDLRSWLGTARVTGQDNAGGVDCERIAAPLRGDAVAHDLAPLAEALGVEAPSVSGRAVACVGFDDRVLHELELEPLSASRRRTAPGSPGPTRSISRRMWCSATSERLRRSRLRRLLSADPGPVPHAQRSGGVKAVPHARRGNALRLRAWNLEGEARRSVARPPKRGRGPGAASRPRPATRTCSSRRVPAARKMRGRATARPDIRQRHYGGGDVYLRRRLIAIGAVIVVIILIFLLVGGC